MSRKLTKRAASRQAEQLQASVIAAETLPLLPATPLLWRILPIAALLLITFIALYPTLYGIYIWDDDQWLTRNPLILEPGLFHHIWFSPTASPHYYPLVFTSYWLECRLFHGLGSWGSDGLLRGFAYHLDNLILHMIAACLVYLILHRLKLPGGKLGAWLSALIFAVHPTSVESVAWIAERKNCLGGVFFFASLYFALKCFHIFPDTSPPGAPHGNAGLWRSNWPTYLLALLLFIASMLSKTTACVVGPVLLLMIWWRRGRISLRDILWTLPFFLIAALMGGFTTYLESQHVGATGPEFAFSFLQRFLIAGSALWFYIWKLFVPYPVMQIYPRFDITAGQPVTNPLYYLAPIAFLALLATLFFLRKKISRGPLTAMLFFAGVLAPALGFINFYTMLYTFVADHYQYYACLGVIVLAVESILLLLKKISTHIPTATDPNAPARFLRLTTSLLWGGILLALVLLTNRVGQLYADGEALWKFNIDHNPACFMIRSCLAATRLTSRPLQVQAAIEALKEAVECDPNDWRAYHGLGMIYLTSNQPELGMSYLLKADKLMPEFVRNRRLKILQLTNAAILDSASQKDQFFSPYFLLGRYYEDNSQYDKAIEQYAIDIDPQHNPNNFAAYLRIGICYQAKEDYPTAIKWYRQTIAHYPNYAQAWWQLGISLMATQNPTEAADALNKAKLLDPLMVEREINRAKAAQHNQPHQ